MSRRRRKRIAWVWSISYTFASACVSAAVWAYLSFGLGEARLQAHVGAALGRQARPESIANDVAAGDVAALGIRALTFVLVLAVPGFEMNQQIWAALRGRRRRIAGAAVYGWKLLVLNLAILLAGPLGACLQFVLGF